MKVEICVNPLTPVFVVLREYQTMKHAINKVENILCFVIVTALQDGFVDMISWFPYEDESCSNSMANYEAVDRCYFGSNAENNKINFPSKMDEWRTKWSLSNLNQCPIRVSVAILPQYAMKSNSASNEELFVGMDVLLMKIIARKLNFTLQLSTNPYNRQEYNALLLIREFQRILLEGEDILIGGVTRQLSNEYILASTDIVQSTDYVSWCVKAITKDGDWKNLFYTFAVSLWKVTILFFIFIAFSINWCLKTYDGRPDFVLSMMYSMQISIGFASMYSPKKNHLENVNTCHSD